MPFHFRARARAVSIVCGALAAMSCAHAPATPAPAAKSGPPAASAGSSASAPTVATSAAAGVRSTQTGVFSADQARRGKDVYAGACQSCHTASDQNGPEFRKHWIGHDLGELFQYLRENMPQDNPGSLTVENATLVTAYIVQLNGLPAGPVPLPSDVAQLKQIRFDTLSKPR